MIKPILFNTEMVQAILEGRKTTTRRVIKNRICIIRDDEYIKKNSEGKFEVYARLPNGDFPQNIILKPPYQPGDILWVRETWFEGDIIGSNEDIVNSNVVIYCADDDVEKYNLDATEMKWRPSIFMPKRLARIFLKVTGVRVERLQDITEEGIINEGTSYDEEIYKMPCNLKNASEAYLRGEFRRLWNKTVNNKDIDRYGFRANPYVWVIEFQRVENLKTL